MRTHAPPLMPIFRSQLQGELLAAVLLSDQERSVSDLAAMVRSPVPTVAREVSRLERAGVFKSRRVGTARLVRADADSPVAEPLTELVLRTFGPVSVLAREFGQLDGIERVEIYGSWAARYQGETGPPPGDIDVLILGSPDRDDVFDAAGRAERILGREVNTTIVSAKRWAQPEGAFLTQVRDRPRVPVLTADETSLRPGQDARGHQ